MSAVPDLVKIGSIKTATDMTVNTTILEPVVNSKSFTRFLLDKTGILHSHSKIAFGIQNEGSSGNAAGQERYVTFPMYTGSYSLINRCVLKAGSKVITSTDDFSHRCTNIDPDRRPDRCAYRRTDNRAHQCPYCCPYCFPHRCAHSGTNCCAHRCAH